KYHLKRLALLVIGACIQEKPRLHLSLACPRIPRKASHDDHIEAGKCHLPVLTFPNMVREHALTGVVRWRLRKLAGTRNITTAHIKPVSNYTPAWDCHACLLSLGYRGSFLPWVCSVNQNP